MGKILTFIGLSIVVTILLYILFAANSVLTRLPMISY